MVEAELAALREHRGQEAAERGVRALARVAGDARLASLAQVGLHAFELGQRPGRRRVGRKPGEHVTSLADEGAGERPIAVERRASPSLLGELERDLRAGGGCGGELTRGVARE